MASTTFIFTLLNISIVMITCGTGNVIRHDESDFGRILSTYKDGTEDENVANGENTYHVLDRLVKSSILKLNDEEHVRIVTEHDIHYKTSVHHFARHGVCRNDKGKARLYAALKSKLCFTTRQFIAQLVEDLCEEQESHLDIWVAELFDINGDGIIGHFEKIFYDD